MIQAVDNAPNFTIKDQDDKEISLTDFSGKWIVLYFYPKDNTSGCTKEACDFTDSTDDFSNLDAVIIGVSPDSSESHRKFIAKHKLGLTLLSDPDKIAHKLYGAWGLKKNYGKEYEGVIRSTFIISPDGKVAEMWKNVRVRVKRKDREVKHADIVKDKLDELRSAG